jgi:acyl phosphate:glycerol-3-phosphate acyltransferase
MVIFWALLAYLAGALPWSVWLGKLLFHTDPRDQADGNPGTANAFRAAGWRLGIVVLVLDFLKGALPVGIARWTIGFSSGELFWIALMPTLGHAFSVFLRFRGGRGIVVLFGVWTGLTLYHVPVVMGAAALLSLALFRNDTYRSLAIPLALIAYLLLTAAPMWMVWLGAAELLVLVLKLGPSLIRPLKQKMLAGEG